MQYVSTQVSSILNFFVFLCPCRHKQRLSDITPFDAIEDLLGDLVDVDDLVPDQADVETTA